MELIEMTMQDGTALVRFQRAPANAFNLAFVERFAELLRQLASSLPRGVVVTGGGKLFSGGVDFREAPQYGDAERMRMIDAINFCMTTLYTLPAPTVAALNGHAMGGAFVLALACDVRLSVAGETRFALSEVTAGIPYPACPMEVVKHELEPQLRRRLVLSGAAIDATEAHQARIVDELCQPDALLPRAFATVAQLSALPGYAAVKKQLRHDAAQRMRAIIDSGGDPMRTRWIG